MSVSLNPRGRNFVRAVALKSAIGGGSQEDMMEVASQRWGTASAEMVVRAAVGAVDSDDVGRDPTSLEFMGLVREQSVFGRLSGLRKVPFNVRMPRIGNGASTYWIGEAAPKPVSKPVVMGSQLKPAKVAGIVVITKEALMAAGRNAETALQNDLVRAVTATWDEAFLDPTNAGEAGVRPASITNGAATVPATADPTADIEALIAAFGGDFASAYFVMAPDTAVHLAKRRTGTAYEFADLGPRGGSILGIPTVTSRAAPAGMVALIDPTGITGGDEGIEIRRASHTSLQMSDDPEDGPTELVSLWQANLIALLAEVHTNWEVQRPGSVAVITGADYAQA